jgi:hypothetical protein
MGLSDLPASGRMYISIASPPDREDLVAEIFFGDEQWAEINTQGGDVNLEIHPRRSGEFWTFNYEDALQAIHEARSQLLDN